MALNLLRAGHRLHVWNRSRPALRRVQDAGAVAADTAREVLGCNPTILLMLANEDAADNVLERATPAFSGNVSGRLIIQMGTTSPGYSQGLERDIRAAGGRYVEAPVSGSRGPAETGTLIAMLAGDREDVEAAWPLMEPMSAQIFDCGPVPSALALKLAVNLFLITMVTGLGEAVHLAARTGVNLDLFRAVLDAGPMASAVSRAKLAKLVSEDLSAQASIGDVWMNSRLVANAARDAGAATALLDQSNAILETTHDLGFAHLDMIALVRGIEARAAALPVPER